MDSSGTEPTIIARGTIHGREARGRVELERTPQGDVLQLVGFWSKEGAPDVRIYLSPDEGGDPEVEGAVDLGLIPQPSGSWGIPISEGLDAEAMRSVVVYCKLYTVIFGTAELEFAAGF